MTVNILFNDSVATENDNAPANNSLQPSEYAMQAIDLVRQAIDRYSTASGDYGVPIKLTQKLPKGDAYLETESPRGQMGFYLVSDGTSIPWRVRARSSSFCNLSVTDESSNGCPIADIPAVVGSLDIVMGEIDR